MSLAATVRRGVAFFAAALVFPAGLSAQDLEPRRWGHLPLGANFAGLGYIRTDGDIALDPVLRLTGVEVEMDTAALKSENDDFFGGKELEQDPLLALQGHAIYTFRPGLWLGASVGYDFGGQSAINGISKDDRREILSWGLTCGVPVSRSVGLKFGYIDQRTQRPTGADLGHFVAAVSVMW